MCYFYISFLDTVWFHQSPCHKQSCPSNVSAIHSHLTCPIASHDSIFIYCLPHYYPSLHICFLYFVITPGTAGKNLLPLSTVSFDLLSVTTIYVFWVLFSWKIMPNTLEHYSSSKPLWPLIPSPPGKINSCSSLQNVWGNHYLTSWHTPPSHYAPSTPKYLLSCFHTFSCLLYVHYFLASNIFYKLDNMLQPNSSSRSPSNHMKSEEFTQ